MRRHAAQEMSGSTAKMLPVPTPAIAITTPAVAAILRERTRIDAGHAKSHADELDAMLERLTGGVPLAEPVRGQDSILTRPS